MIDTMNAQLVGRQGEDIIVMLPKVRMTKDEAIVHAAWLVALATMGDTEPFDKALEAVLDS